MPKRRLPPAELRCHLGVPPRPQEAPLEEHLAATEASVRRTGDLDLAARAQMLAVLRARRRLQQS